MTVRTIALLVVLGLSGCKYLTPTTTIYASYSDPNGAKFEASYASPKDVTAPSLILERDPVTGRITALRFTEEGALSSPVIAANASFMQSLGAAFGAGIAEALKMLGVAGGMPPPANYNQSSFKAPVSPGQLIMAAIRDGRLP
jgi:hypothetical protein